MPRMRQQNNTDTVGPCLLRFAVWCSCWFSQNHPAGPCYWEAAAGWGSSGHTGAAAVCHLGASPLCARDHSLFLLLVQAVPSFLSQLSGASALCFSGFSFSL